MFGPVCSGESTAAEVVCLFATILVLAIIARALLSWFNLDPRSPIIQALDAVVDPIVAPIRNVMPRIGMFDLSPLVAIILVQVIANVLASFFDGNA